MGDLPAGWLNISLIEIAELIMGQSPPSSSYNIEGIGLPFFQGKAEFQSLYPKVIKYCDHPTKIAQTDDILLSVRAPVGPTNLCPDTSCIGRGLAAIRPKPITDHRYLLRYFRFIEPLLSQQGTGSTFQAISKKDVESIEVLLAPLNEQCRIVAKLEKLLAKVDACKERLEKIPAILKRFRQSVLAAAFSGSLTSAFRKRIASYSRTEALSYENENQRIPCLWRHTKLGDLIREGPKNGLYKPQSDYGSGVRIVRIDNFYDGEIKTWEKLKRLRVSEKDLEDYGLQNDDLVINRVNSMKFLGKSCLVRGLDAPCVFESNMMRIRVKKELVLPEYLIAYLNSSSGLNELRKNAKHAVNQSSINQQDVQNAAVVLPPLEEQAIIIQKLNELFQLSEKIMLRYQGANIQVDKLTQSILAKAFRGELVPQDPNDEPAWELLKRIQEERRKQEAEGRPGRRGSKRRVKNHQADGRTSL